MKTMREATGLLMAATLAALLAGCAESGRTAFPGDGEPPTPGGTVVIAEAGDMNLPLAILSQGGLDSSLQDVLYMGLLHGAWVDGRLVFQTSEESPMALARRYEFVGDDSSAIRFHMRSDANWSDGEPITAHDVTFTYEALRDPMIAAPRQDYAQNIQSVTAENDSTVLFRFLRRYPEMFFHAAHGIIPRHVYEDVHPSELRTHASVQNPEDGGLVVSGPYQISAWSRGQQVTLSPNPHFVPQPYLDQIVFRIIPAAATRLVELSTGGVDWVNGVSFDQIPTLRAQAPHVRFEREEKRYFDYVAYSPSFEPFDDPEVRRALGLAVDVPAMLEALQMTDYALPANGPYAPIFADLYDPAALPPLGYDPERARQILAERGWVDGNEDGVLEKDGRPFRFTLLTNSGNQRRADVSQILQQHWKAIGVDVRLQAQEFNTFSDALNREDYEAALGGWGVALSPDLSNMWSPISPLNIVSYDNPATQALFQQALAQPTEARAIPIWKEAARLLVDDQPYTWLYYMDQVDGINERVRGVVVNTFGPYQNTWEWWIPRALQGTAAQDSVP